VVRLAVAAVERGNAGACEIVDAVAKAVQCDTDPCAAEREELVRQAERAADSVWAVVEAAEGLGVKINIRRGTFLPDPEQDPGLWNSIIDTVSLLWRWATIIYQVYKLLTALWDFLDQFASLMQDITTLEQCLSRGRI
jgi:hypothetical protein